MCVSKFEGQTIEILNWEKFNPRPDRKTSTWFRMDHSIFEDPKFDDLTPDEIAAFLYLLCMASKASSCTVTVKYSHAERIAKIKNQTLSNVITKLQQSQFLIITGDNRCQVVTDGRGLAQSHEGAGALRTNVRTYEHANATDAISLSRNDLVGLWNSNCGPLPRISKLTAKRNIAINKRLSEEPDLKTWETAIKKLAVSSFACGDNKQGWKANIDFLLRPDSLVKILEGQYDNAKKTSTTVW